MKAMILAAGLGTRLKPITDNIPKALVEVEGMPILERQINKLKSHGFDEIIINIHHFSEKIKSWISENNFGVRIKISDESEQLLDTGGGINNAYDLIFENNNDPILIHNVDILSNLNPRQFMELHEKSGNDATLLVSQRDSSRKLIFDENMNLRGWHDLKNDKYLPDNFMPTLSYSEYPFSGIYIMSKTAISEMKSMSYDAKFSVINYFLDKNRKSNIKGLYQEELELLDIGKPASLAQASNFFQKLNNSY